MVDKLEIRRAYSRGYNAARAGLWPQYKPPRPPDEVLATFFDACLAVRNEIDGFCAKMPEDDEECEKLWRACDKMTEALAAVREWLNEPPGKEPTDGVA